MSAAQQAADLRQTGPGALSRTRDDQLAMMTAARVARRRKDSLGGLRTLCEDADELLGQAAEAARVGDAGAALEPLAQVREVATSILRALRRTAMPGSGFCGRPHAVDEDQIQATAVIVEELDAQLRDAGIGYRGAGDRAGQLASHLLMTVDTLMAAAASGRTRSHASRSAGDAA